MTLRLSIIIPTHKNSISLPRTLGALAKQTVAPEEYEVILVADGGGDGTASLIRRLDLPYTLKFIEQPQSGAAAARNRGAAAAAGLLLLFLDDDMEAVPGLVGAHLAAHAEHPGGVVLGYFPIPEDGTESDPFAMASKLWWDERFAERERPAHRFTFRDFCTGNVSLPRELFEALGGFDPTFPGASTEDYELGMRLLKRGVRFHFVRAAASIHHDRPSPERALRRARADGRGHAILTRKHPELFWELKICRAPSGPVLRPLWHLLWSRPALAALLAQALHVLLFMIRGVKVEGAMWRVFGCLDGYCYWSAVRDELGSMHAWRRLAKIALRQPKKYTRMDLNLATDLSELETILGQTRVDAVFVQYGAMPIGEIAPVAGAEPLRAVHVREELIQRFSGRLLGALILHRLQEEPPVVPTAQTAGRFR